MWTAFDIHGKRVEIFEPSTVRAIGCLLFLHDRNGTTLRSYPEAEAWLRANRLAIVCPLGGACWWTDRIWAGFDEKRSAERWLIDELVPEASRRFGAVTIALAGIGMGGQGALRMAFKHPELFPIVAALDAAVDCHDLYYEGTPLDEMYPSREHCRQDSPVLHVKQETQPRHLFFGCSSDSRWERGNDRLHEKLTALGVPHRYATEPAEIGMPALLQFVASATTEESRRLL